MNISPTGIWLCDTPEPHSFDEGLSMAILDFCRIKQCRDALDFGCGNGRYVSAMRADGIDAEGYDGNPRTPEFQSYCYIQDLTEEFYLGQCDLVLSLETGEHIPAQHGLRFLDNICGHARNHVILSWFPTPGHGIGHINEQSNEWVIDRMLDRGFEFNVNWTAKLRDCATLWWFKESLMVYNRI